MRKALTFLLLGVVAVIFSGCCNNGGGSVQPQPSQGEVYIALEDAPGGLGDLEIYVTDKPIRGVNYSAVAAGTGEYSSSAYNYGTMTASYWAYATQWDDGSVTYSDAPYDGVSYSTNETTEYNHTGFVNDGSTREDELQASDPDDWRFGTADSGYKPSDYEYIAGTGIGNDSGRYALINGQTDDDQNDDLVPDDDNDLDNDQLPNDNDSVPIDTPQVVI
ncbi:MAG: hypothetical protein LBT09_05655 [Planctomycetaceae bacterium]|jgi:hypothetical protein|nr:hypothetical protein [Planctomycetaceae bacterium]